jgi:hypothetical protein
MIRRILISALVVIFVQTSVPVSSSAEQPASKSEPTKSAASLQPPVYPDVPQATPRLDLQHATRALVLTGSTLQSSKSFQQTLRQATSEGGGLTSHQKLIVSVIIIGAAVGILALENVAPKGNDARCSSANPQFCN